MPFPTIAPPPRPAELAEEQLVTAILSGQFPIDSTLPAERELAKQLGVTRPTLREALQRMARDGWVEINQGKPTRVCNYWKEGQPAILSTIAHKPEFAPPDFVRQLLEVRNLLAPEYARLAVEYNQATVVALLDELLAEVDSAETTNRPTTYATADFNLHHALAVASDNRAYPLILNGFASTYRALAVGYFLTDGAQRRSHDFYMALLQTARAGDWQSAETITRQAMQTSLTIWDNATS